MLEDGAIRPWAGRADDRPRSLFEERRAWAESEIDLPPRRADGEEIPAACRAAVEDLCTRMKWREDRPRLLVLSPDGDAGDLWSGRALRQGKPVRVTYSPRMGVWVERE